MARTKDEKINISIGTKKAMTSEVRKRMSDSMKGRIPWNKGKPRDEATKQKIRDKLIGSKQSLDTRKKKSVARNGSLNPNWKGGITKENSRLRSTLDYRLWRDQVFARDGYTCILGGKEHGNKLHADHIKPFALFPELRLDVGNGRTLCEECHKKTPTFLRSNLTKDLFE